MWVWVWFAKTKMNITAGCLPSDSSNGRRKTPVGKSLKAQRDPEGVSMSQCSMLPYPRFCSPLGSLYPLFSQDNHSSWLVPKANLLLTLRHSRCHHLLCCFCIHLCVELMSSVFNYKFTAMKITFYLIVSIIMSILRRVTKTYS